MLVAGGILAGCGSSDDGKTADGKTKITFWDENAGPQRTPIWEKLIADFEDANPDIDVEYVGLPKDSSKSKLDTAIAADDMPDVGSVQTSWLPEFSIREALLPLDDYLVESELNALINEGAVTFNKDVVRDGKLYGIPYTKNLDVIWIRSDWFKDAGFEAPDTWDELLTACEEMTVDGRDVYPIRGGSGGSSHCQR